MNGQPEKSLAERAQSCLNIGDVVQARKLFDNLRVAEPENSEAWLMSGALLGEAGSVDEAIDCLQTALRLNPEYPEAHLTMAHLLHAKSRLNDAYENVKQALEIDSTYDEAWVFLGAICCELSLFEEAERACGEAINRWPENVNAHVSLATSLCYLGRNVEAEPVLRHAIDLAGGYLPSVDALLERILIGKGDNVNAEPYIKSALASAPDDITLLLNLANIRLGQRQFEQAIDLFRGITENNSESVDAWLGLGLALHGHYNLKEAEACYQKARDLDSSSLPATYNLAILKQAYGEFSSAIDLLEEALVQYPGRLNVIGYLASIYEQIGEQDKAISTIIPVLDQPEKDVQIAKTYQKLCVKLGQCAEAEIYLKATLETVIVNPEEKAILHFCLGELYDKQGNYDLAFEQFLRANEYKTEKYDSSIYSKYIDMIISTFSASSISSYPVSKQLSDQQIFIVGMPRSGTSLVEKILSSHSEVYGAGELRNITDFTENMFDSDNGESNYLEAMAFLTQARVDALSDQYIDFITDKSSDAKRVTDKMPHNFQYLGLIKHLFPNAKIIHCVQDARDTCLSCYFQNFLGYHPYTNDLNDLALHYLDYQRLMSHWKSLEIPMLEVRYEDLVNDQELWSKKLISYCDLDWEDDCLRFYEKGEQTRTASYDQVRQPIYQKSLARWKDYRSHLGSMLDILGS